MDEVHSRPPSRMSEEEVQDIQIYTQSENTSEKQCESVESPSSAILTTRRPTKRYRADVGSDEQEQNNDDSGFIIVRRKNKRAVWNNQENLEKTNNYHDVSITSQEMLPKQIGLARLLKSEGITSASKIKYKNAYKVIITFEEKEQALTLINNTKLMELGYRCHFTTEVDISYGVVKYVEVDISDDELLKSFSSEYKIVSVKRLKRLAENSTWIESETVRFGFKSSVLPPYVHGYECRFKVEPYTFPVTQCGTCWKFGHITRTCSAKIVCPKCGGNHDNCNITELKCVNCKQKHISFSKVCPVYLKEKEIRCIMSQNNSTYKVALSLYLKNNSSRYEKEAENRYSRNLQFVANNTQPSASSKLYSSVLQQPVDFTSDSINSSEIEMEDKAPTEEKKRAKKNKKKKTNVEISTETLKERPQEESRSTAGDTQENEKRKSLLTSFLNKMKETMMSERSLEEKIKYIMKILFQEIIAFLVRTVSSGEVFKLLDTFSYG